MYNRESLHPFKDIYYIYIIGSKDVLVKWKYLTDKYKKVYKEKNTEEPTRTGAEESKSTIIVLKKHYEAMGFLSAHKLKQWCNS